jgi:hypothetical protein
VKGVLAYWIVGASVTEEESDMGNEMSDESFCQRVFADGIIADDEFRKQFQKCVCIGGCGVVLGICGMNCP